MEVPILVNNFSSVDQEEIFEERSSPSRFNTIVGTIEDIMVSPEFQHLQERLLTRFCELFDESTEENKLIYMELFQEYNQSIEKFLIQELSKQVEDFSFKSFCDELKCHTNTLSEDILEMVCSITDFSAFKEMVLEHKKSFLVVDPLNSGLVIKKLNFNNN